MVSFVIPVRDEEEVLPDLVRRLMAVLDNLAGGPHEVFLVDDGSMDSTAKIIRESAAKDPRFKSIHLSRNFGHQAAITAGLDHVRGDWVVTMDGDLQDPPEEVPKLLKVAYEGYDVVYARRVGRKESWVLRAAYFSAYRLIAFAADIEVPLDSGDFGVMSRRVVEGLRRTSERQRFLRGLRAWQGFRQIGNDCHNKGVPDPVASIAHLILLWTRDLLTTLCPQLQLLKAVRPLAEEIAGPIERKSPAEVGLFGK
jgi:dolichol-phosphate mannosyltransferase